MPKSVPPDRPDKPPRAEIRVCEALEDLVDVQFQILQVEEGILRTLQQGNQPSKATLFIEWFFPQTGTRLKGAYIMTTFPKGGVADLTLTATDDLGNPAKVDGVPTWDNSQPAFGDMFVAADGLSGKLTWLAPGTGQIKVVADADLGAGVRELTALGDYEMLPGEATVLALSFGPVTVP